MSTLAGRGAVCSSDVPPFLFEQKEKMKVIVKTSLLFNHLWQCSSPPKPLQPKVSSRASRILSSHSCSMQEFGWSSLFIIFFLFFFSLHYVNSKSTGVWFVTFLALRLLSTVLSLTHSIRTFDPVIVSEAIPVLAFVFGRGLKSGNNFL